MFKRKREILAKLWGNNNGSGSSAQSVLDGAPFLAELTHSLVLARGTGSPTFTRASTATFRDWEGVLKTVPSGCARFEGARMERNLLTFTEDFSNAAWTKINGGAGSAPTVTSGFTDPDGGTTAWRLQANAGGVTGSDYSVVRQSIASAITYGQRSIYIKSNTGVSQVVYFGAAESDDSVTATTEWQQLAVLNSASSGLFDIGCYRPGGVGSGAQSIDVLIWHPNLANVTGETDQTTIRPYVSVGVESAPYHGAGVDGVEFFNTDRDGALLSPQPAYLAEGARTNLGIRSNEYNSWTDVLTPSATQNLVGPDGATSGWTFTDNDPANIEYKTLNTTLTAATHTESVFAAKTVGATTFPVIFLIEGTRVAVCTIDTNNGIATAWTAYTGLTVQTSSAVCRSHNSAWWKVELTFLATAALWSRGLMPAGTTNATQSTGTIASNVTGSAGFFGSQIELGSSASSYIPTTTAAVTRAADVLTYPSAGNISVANGWCYAETTTEWLVSLTNARVVSARNSGAKLVPMWNTAAFAIYDGATTATSGAFAWSATPVKAASSWATGGNMVVYKSGTGGTPVGYTPGTVETSIGIGCNPDGSDSWFGTIRNVRIGQRQLSASEMQAITA